MQSLVHRLPNPPHPWLGRDELELELSRALHPHVHITGPGGSGKTSLICTVLANRQAEVVYVDARRNAPQRWWTTLIQALQERASSALKGARAEVQGERALARAIDIADTAEVVVVLDHIEVLGSDTLELLLDGLSAYPRKARWYSLQRGPALGLAPHEIGVSLPTEGLLARWLEDVEPDADEVWRRTAVRRARRSWSALHAIRRERVSSRWFRGLDPLLQDGLKTIHRAGKPRRLSARLERCWGALERAGLLATQNPDAEHELQRILERLEDHLRLEDLSSFEALLTEHFEVLLRSGWAPEILTILEPLQIPSLDAQRLYIAQKAQEMRGPVSVDPPRTETPEAWMQWAQLQLHGGSPALARAAAEKAGELMAPATDCRICAHADLFIAITYVHERDWARCLEQLGHAQGAPRWSKALRACVLFWSGHPKEADGVADRLFDVLVHTPLSKTVADYCARRDVARVLHLLGRLRDAQLLLSMCAPAPPDRDLFEPYQERPASYMRALIDYENLELERCVDTCRTILESATATNSLGLHARNLLLGVFSLMEDEDEVERVLEAQRRALSTRSSDLFEATWVYYRFAHQARTRSWWVAGHVSSPQSLAFVEKRLRHQLAEQRWRKGEATAAELQEHDVVTLTALSELGEGVPGEGLAALVAELERAERLGRRALVVRRRGLLWQLQLGFGLVDEARGTLERLLSTAVANGLRRPSAARVGGWLSSPGAPDPDELTWATRIERLILGGEVPDRLEARLVEVLWGQFGWRPVTFSESPQFWVDPQRNVLWTQSGVRIVWRPNNRSFTCLVDLLKHRGEVSKETLLRTVWGIADHHPLKHENRLRVAVFKLRKRLHEHGLPGDEWVLTTDDGYAASGGALIHYEP